MEQKDNSHRQWAQGKKPSMKRRCEEKDYTERGLYMVTLAIEGRQPLLGTLEGNPDIREGEGSPHVTLSPLGQAVARSWQAIAQYYPQIEPIKLCIMPDHIHGILFVKEKIERHLGHVINGFKSGTRRAARELGITERKAEVKTETEAEPQHTELSSTATAPAPAAPKVPYAGPPAQLSKPSKHPPRGTLWEPGYNDRLLLHKGQLQHMLAYLDDNPRRLLLKRQHPEYFTQLAPIPVLDNINMPAMGNRYLLERPLKLQVQCSRHLYPWEIDQRKQAFLEAGRQGAVIVSPCISPGEQQIATACLEEGIPLIVLLLKGFPPYFKPHPRYLQACAEGRLLMLAPYPFQNEKLTDMRARCLALNDLAARICQDSAKLMY